MEYSQDISFAVAECNQPVYRRTLEEKEGITKNNSESGPTNVDALPGSSNTEKSFNCELFSGKEDNCDRVCKKQPCEHIKIAYFFQLCSIIIYNLFVQIEQN